MKESTLHVAIIMDGNGRWAERRGQMRLAGHEAGAHAVRRTVEAAPALGIRFLTLYAFSSDNWGRPAAEVDGLMTLFATYLRGEASRCAREGVRLTMIGRRDRLPEVVRASLASAEEVTAPGDRLHLRIAIDYSARDAIVAAAARAGGRSTTRESFRHFLTDVPDVDLLIRTGGEQRLSDFLLWENAYAELYFTQTMWPDFNGGDLRRAVQDFHARQRRFGILPEAAVVP